ncbi:MAG: DMT family transporter [Saezia sp.]
MSQIKGHILAIITILLWGTTFVSTKLLLVDFSPLEILVYRFVLGIVALYLVYPKPLKGLTWRQELYFAAAGFFGITLYYLLENIALTMTYASNAALITSSAPFFTMLAAYWFLKEEQLKPSFFVGFAVSIIGIALISFNGATVIQLNPRGDLLALLAAVAWAGYSVFAKKIGAMGFNTIQTTRRMFAYGLFFMTFSLFFLDFDFKPDLFLKPINFSNLLYLGLGASALCFVTWNMAMRELGAVKASLYIYLVPIITVAASVIILDEKITLMSGIGILLTFAGLIISKINWRKRT